MLAPAWVAPYIGLPYEPGGRTVDAVDCWGLFALAEREHFGTDVAEYDGPLYQGRQTAEEVSAAAQTFAARFREIPEGQEQAGDAVLFDILGAPLHIGIVVAPGLMLHAQAGALSCVENYRTTVRWRSRVRRFYRAE